MKYQIVWYDGFGGRPDYSKKEYDTPSEAQAAAELMLERAGCDDVAYGVVTAKSHRRVWLSGE